MATQSAGKPNIVLITTDTQGREMISSYVDRPGVETPNIDRLARRGVLFENCFTTSPVCTPARSSWYTGLYPNRNGAWANELAVSRDVPLLGEQLTAQGYRAWHVGKWHLDAGGYTGRGVADGGFAEDAWYDLRNFYDEVGRDGINRFGGWNRGLDDVDFCFAHRVADRAITLLSQHQPRETPFFLSVSFDEPHGPYICPPPFRGKFSQAEIYKPSTFMADLAGKPRIQQEYADFLARARPTPDTFPGYYHRYYDCNSYVDAEIGRVLDAIDRYCPDAVVIFTSDHGDHLGAFGLCAKGPTMYDHTIAVPLIVAAPAFAGDLRNRGLVSSVDIWATIQELAGIPAPQNSAYVGRSLLPILAGQSTQAREAVIVEYNRFGRLHHQAEGFFPIRCIRSQRWKLSINLFDRDEFYDLEADPAEANNLIDEPSLAAERTALHDQLLAWQDETRDLFRSPQWGQRPWRTDYAHQFQGFFTTGYADAWPFGSLDD